MAAEDDDLGTILEQGRITLRVLLTEDGEHIIGVNSKGLSCLEAHGVLAMALNSVGNPDAWDSINDDADGGDVEDV